MSSNQCRQLGKLGLQIQALFDDVPQDVEWAFADGRLWGLQARPITNLPPPPLQHVTWQPPPGAKRLVRRQVVENMPEPLSPLFEDLYLRRGLDLAMDDFATLMELPFELDLFVERPMFVTVNGYGYSRYDLRFSRRAAARVPRILWWYATKLPGFLRRLLPLWRDEGLPQYLQEIRRFQSLDATSASQALLLTGLRTLSHADARYWFYVSMMVGAAKMTEGLLAFVLRGRAFAGLTTGRFLAGYASPTLNAQKALEAIAGRIRRDAALLELVVATPPAALLTALRQSATGRALVEDIEACIHGGHQVYNLDFAEPTQGEDPTLLLLSLQGLARHPQETVDRRLEALRHAGDQLIAETLPRLWPLRRRLFERTLRWARRFAPYREEALFHMGAAWPTLRVLALELGHRLQGAGVLSRADDVFYLTDAELTAACADPADLSALVTERRTLREQRRRLHPPGRVPEDLRIRVAGLDVTHWFATMETQKRNESDADQVNGFAVSPGRVTGPASVIRSPADFASMQPGSILVCPTTTPAWTPLFGQATGLVTDIGAVLAHGSIVAREYGIPAVLGTGDITQRVTSGQIITVDGDRGTVTLAGAPTGSAG